MAARRLPQSTSQAAATPVSLRASRAFLAGRRRSTWPMTSMPTSPARAATARPRLRFASSSG
eukprot:8715813-Alexandrium_andersonii.AAC.1